MTLRRYANFKENMTCGLKKRFEKISNFPPPTGQEENISGNSIERSLLIYFENFQGAPCSHRQNRNRMMNPFIIVNITPTCS